MLKFPIKYYDENIIFSDDGSWATFEINGYDYDNQSKDSKLKILDNITNFLAGVTTELKVLLIPTNQDSKKTLRKNYTQMRDNDPLKEVAKEYTEGTIDYLTEKQKLKKYTLTTGEEIEFVEDEVTDYKTFILIKLEDLSEKDFLNNIKSCLDYIVNEPKKAIDKLLGVRDTNILQSQIEALKKRSRAFLKENELRVSLTTVKGEDIEWLSRRINKRGLNVEKNNNKFVPLSNIEQVDNENDIRIDPLTNDIKCLFEGKITQQDRSLKISTENGESYQSFLTLTEMPDLIFPGSEYIFMTQDINIPIETCIHIKNLNAVESKHIVSRYKKKIESEIANAGEAGLEASEDTYIALEEVRDMDSEVNLRKKLTKTTISFCISADKPEKLESNVNLVMNYYKDRDFVLQRPVADQLKLYMEFIPGASRYTEDFTRLMSIKTLAGTGIGATRLLGDSEGFYIGVTGILSKKVFLNMARACLENKSASATFYGNLGTGKSFAANLLTLIHVIFGGYALIFDPKGERGQWIEKLPWLQDLVSIIRLTGEDKYKGMLDPFNVYKDNVDDACELAVNIVSELNQLSPKDDEFIVLKEAVIKVKESKVRSMKRLIEVLEEYPEADELSPASRRLARKLKTSQAIGMSKLLFGDGSEISINFDNRINILQIDNLKIPQANIPKEEYTDEENLSTVLLMVMSQFAKKFALTPRKNFKIVLFDESWFMKNSIEGKKLYSFLTRMGRSLFTGCIFNGHSVLDIPSDEIKNTISYKFCFRTNEIEEAKRMCDYLKIDVSDGNIKTLMNLGNGECLFRDLDGRVGNLKFDAVFGDIINAFDTTPKEDKKSSEEEITTADEQANKRKEKVEVNEKVREKHEIENRDEKNKGITYEEISV